MLISLIFIMNSCSPDSLNSVSTSAINSNSQKVDYAYSSPEIETMGLINSYRVSKGLNLLKDINYISLKAEEHNTDMIAVNSISHNGFVARSEDIIKVLGAIKVSENVAYNYPTSQAAVAAWLNSPAHRINIEGDFTNFGMSIRLDLEGRKYYTNIFVKM